MVSLLFHASRRYLIEILLRHKTIIALLSLFFCLISIPFITIYLPAYKEVGQYSFTEASAMIPRPVSYLLMGDGNYWWRALQRFAGALPHCWEHNIGFGFILSGLWILFSLQTLFKSSQERSQAFVSALVISTNIVILLALDYNGWSPWRYVYEYVPGAKSIRSVSRISLITIGVIIVTLVASTVKLGASQTVFSKWQSRFFFALLSLACVEQIGEANSFDKSKISTELESAAGRVSKDCLAFYVINGITPQDQIWDMQAWAIYVAALTKIPTLNGYSGQFPPQWNLLDVNSSNYQVEVGNWVVRHNLTGKICSLGIQ